MSPWRLAVLSLRRRRVPTFITALSIAVSVACSGILLRLYHLSASRFDSMSSAWEAIVGAKAGGLEIVLNALNGEGPYPDYLPYVLYQSLHAGQEVHFEDGQDSKPQYIKSVSPFVYFAKLKNARVAGTDEAFVHAAADFAEGHWPDGENQVVLGANTAARGGFKVGDSVEAQMWLGPREAPAPLALKVAGVLRPSGSAWDRMAFSDVITAQKAISAHRELLGNRSIWGERVLNYFFINLQPGGMTSLQNLVNKRTVGQVVEVAQEKMRLDELIGAGKNVGLFVSVFVLLLSTLSVSGMLITRFDAMTVQLAVLRALGRSRIEIAQWLLWEGILLGFVGVVMGAAIDAAVFPQLRRILAAAIPPEELVSSCITESWPIWALALLATVFAIFIPLIRLYRQDVHQALKS